MVKSLLAAALASIAAATALAQNQNMAANVPASIKPSDDLAVYLTVPAHGFQVYSCANSANGVAWSLKAPDARLFNPQGSEIGKHYAGPTWEGSDGGKVVAAVRTSAAAPGDGAIPWLLLDVKSRDGAGAFSEAKAILRIMTVGGTAPASGCDEAHAGSESKVPYTATYLFLK